MSSLSDFILDHFNLKNFSADNIVSCATGGNRHNTCKGKSNRPVEKAWEHMVHMGNELIRQIWKSPPHVCHKTF